MHLYVYAYYTDAEQGNDAGVWDQSWRIRPCSLVWYSIRVGVMTVRVAWGIEARRSL